MRLLITGGAGQLGCALLSHPACHHHTIYAPSHRDLDITDINALHRCLKQFPAECIINTAAYTAVDKAEQESDLALHINQFGAENIATICAENHIKLIHLSTDYIFGGDQQIPYSENDSPHPLNVYGLSKWLGECAIRETAPEHIILRVSGVFSEYQHNFCKTMLRLAQEKPCLKIVSDQITCPTDAFEIAHVLYQLIQHPELTGTWHFCSEVPTSWFEFTKAILAAIPPQKLVMAKEIIPISAAEFNAPAARPAYSVLNCQKIKSQLNLTLPNWQDGIQRVLRALL